MWEMEKEIFAKTMLLQICENVQENKWLTDHQKGVGQQSIKGKSFLFL